MDLSKLLEEALAERGNAVMLIARPRDGENALIDAGNAPFARSWVGRRLAWPACVWRNFDPWSSVRKIGPL
jgi:hypothetical protein